VSYITGLHAIEERIKKGRAEKLYFVSTAGQRAAKIVQMAQRKHIPVAATTSRELDRMVPGEEHRGVVLMVSEKSAPHTQTDLKGVLASLQAETSLFLVLDSIQDPHNLGAILRSADQFQVDCVVIPEKRSVKDTPTVSRVSTGADSFVPLITVTNLARSLDLIKEYGFWVYGADMQGQPAPSISFDRRTVIVMGQEGEGLRKLVREKCDMLVRIPAHGHVDSFNVSVAAGILMYEVRRQQGIL
jgi:23S rRNA (guanosine2251-2'-O)-methyltransferase